MNMHDKFSFVSLSPPPPLPFLHHFSFSFSLPFWRSLFLSLSLFLFISLLHTRTYTHTKGLPGAFASGCTYPPVVNDNDMFFLSHGAATSLVGAEFVKEATATMGGEDFAYFAEKVPANFVYLGIGNAAKNTTVGLHSPSFKLDEDALALGAALHVTTALHALHDLGGLSTSKFEL